MTDTALRPPPVSLAGWGRQPTPPSRPVAAGTVQDVATAITEAPGRLIARGAGCSYGDAALCHGGTVLDLRAFNHVLTLDPATGVITAEAGTVLAALMAAGLAHGWLPPVLPGTAHATIGGAVAADVHGKNHVNAGSFGAHVCWLDLLSADGSTSRLSPHEHPEQFWATVGGMGLTGVIVRVALQMIRAGSGHAVRHHRRAADLDTVMALMDDAAGRQLDDQHLHVVAWLDGTTPAGRGIVETIRLLDDDGLPRAVAPAVAPRARIATAPGPGLITRPLVRTANALRWHSAAGSRWATAPIGHALQPLDQLELWPALFGRRGLLQYQCAIPDGAEATIGQLLREVTRAGLPPALATLKRLGPAGPGPLSFPLAGWTLAMDFPVRWSGLESELRRLDELVVAAGGRVYLAKDSRMSPETVSAMYPGLDRWRRIRDGMDPTGAFGSDLGARLGLVTAMTS